MPPSGQRWTTHDELAGEGGPDKRHSEFWDVEPGLTGIGVSPAVGIGQRALLVRTGRGNLLWDPPASWTTRPSSGSGAAAACAR